MFYKFASDTDKLLDLLNENERRIGSNWSYSNIGEIHNPDAQMARKLTDLSIKYIAADTIDEITSNIKSAIFNGHYCYVRYLPAVLTTMDISKIKNHFTNLGYKVHLDFNSPMKITISWS